MTEIIFPEGNQPSWKSTEIPGGGGGGGGYNKHPLKWKFQGDVGSKAKVPSGANLFENNYKLHT